MKRGLAVLLALVPLTFAAPSPNVIGEIDLGDFLDLPAPSAIPVDVISTSVDLAAVATSLAAQQSVTADDSAPTVIPLRKRQSTCKPFSSFASINSDLTKGTPSAFQNYQPWQAASGPLGTYGLPVYEGVNSVGPKNGLLSVNAYSTYDPSVCQAKCDSLKGCVSFAIWRERVPTQKYDASTCPSPSTDAAFQTKCLYYSFKLAASDATNKGQWTNNGKFNVVQTSVKFFNKGAFRPPAVDGFSAPTGGWGVCAPRAFSGDGEDVQTAAGMFHVDVLARDPGPMTTAVDPSFCASQCRSITSDGQPDGESGIKLNCNMFSLFLLSVDGRDAWQCQYWTKDLDASKNTNCGPRFTVAASWKYVASGSNAVAPYVNTKPQVSLPQCTGSDSSTFGVRCLEDFKNLQGRSDSIMSSTKLFSYDGKPNSYYSRGTQLAGFSGLYTNYMFNKPNYNQLDATRLAGDGFFGLVGANGHTATLTANGFVFDLESIDIGRWFLYSVESSDTMQLQGLRNGQVVTQPTPAYPIPRTAGAEWIHATGLLALGFTNLDAIQMTTSVAYGSYDVYQNLVLTRHAVPSAGRRDLQSISRRDANESFVADFPGYVSTGIESPIFDIAYTPINETSSSKQTSSSN
ncbi:hypothetical protein PHBOTO_003112 [Pseudozyma hubeiensis]|nr:hypothetical protein PHBOTO_003112 [Pseudozyma hubeiensis]